jgi:VWFA-related protein
MKSVWLLLLALLGVLSAARPAARAPMFQQIRAASRPAASIFQSEPGALRPLQVSFDPRTRAVTITLSVEDPKGYFIPNLRRENFAVYEDGVEQKSAAVEIEHAPLALSVLLEGGSRYQQLNGFLNTEIPFAASKFSEALLPGDKVAVFSYATGVKTLAEVDAPPERLESIFRQFRASGFAESNLYDAVIDVLNRTDHAAGQRALLLISTGLDSFSQATLDDVIARATRAGTPMYCIGLADMVQRTILSIGPVSQLDWNRANKALTRLAQTTDGRAYLRGIDLDSTGIYDDLMERLRVRYVITYTPSLLGTSGLPKKVRVALVDAETRGPLRIVDASGKRIQVRVSTEATYIE